MANEPTDDNSNLVDIPEDLTSFKALFEGREAPKVEDTEDDALATDEDTDAAEEADEANDQEDLESDDDADESDDTDEDESDDEDKSEEEPKDKGKKQKSRYQTRIDELTRTAREAERRESALLARLEALETKNKPVQEDSPQESIADALPPGAPKPDDVDAKGVAKYPLGEFDPSFIRDMTKFSVKMEIQADREARARQEAERQKAQEVEAIRTGWEQKLSAAEEEIPDIREHIADLVNVFQSVEPAYGEYLATIVMTSENGPAIMEYLSQNIGEAQKIVASGPTAATLAIGRLEAKLQNVTTRPAGEEKRNKKPSGAPPPPTATTRGTKGGAAKVRPDTEDLAAFKRDFFS